MNRKDIPKHWKWVTLNDIGIVVSGGTPSTKEHEFWNGNIPWITPADLSSYEDVYISKGQRNISQVGLEYSSATLLPENSIIFSSRAPIGYVAITKNKLATNQGFKNLILPSNLINPKYVYYYLKTIKELAENMASGTTFLELSASKFKEIPFPLAPIEEQNRIVEKIEELFSEFQKFNFTIKRELERISALKQQRERFYFHFENKNTEPLLNILKLKSGDPLPLSQRNKNGEYLVYGGNGVLGNHDKYLFEEPLLIIGRVGEYCGNTHITQSKSWVTENALIVHFKVEANLSFFKHYFKFLNFRIYAKSSSQPVISVTNISNIKAYIPSIEEQNTLINLYEQESNNIDKLIEDINIEHSKTKLLESKILQQAFNGELTSQINIDTPCEVLLNEIEISKKAYLKEQQEIIKNRPKILRMEKEKLSIIQVLEKYKAPISAKQLWEESMFSNDIEKFYSELKKVESKIQQNKSKKETLISLK